MCVAMNSSEAYAVALAAGEPQRLLRLLTPEATFQSPFSFWHTPDAVAAAFSARCSAFAGLEVHHVLHGDGNAVLLWCAQVDGRRVEGCEALTLTDGRISRVDVFLRPAAELATVRAAMTAAWPSNDDDSTPATQERLE